MTASTLRENIKWRVDEGMQETKDEIEEERRTGNKIAVPIRAEMGRFTTC